jgi:hypothetical protein
MMERVVRVEVDIDSPADLGISCEEDVSGTNMPGSCSFHQQLLLLPLQQTRFWQFRQTSYGPLAISIRILIDVFF